MSTKALSVAEFEAEINQRWNTHPLISGRFRDNGEFREIGNIYFFRTQPDNIPFFSDSPRPVPYLPKLPDFFNCDIEYNPSECTWSLSLKFGLYPEYFAYPSQGSTLAECLADFDKKMVTQ